MARIVGDDGILDLASAGKAQSKPCSYEGDRMKLWPRGGQSNARLRPGVFS